MITLLIILYLIAGIHVIIYGKNEIDFDKNSVAVNFIVIIIIILFWPLVDIFGIMLHISEWITKE